MEFQEAMATGFAADLDMICNTLVMTLTQYFVFMRLTEFRFDKKKTYIASVIMLAVCVTSCVVPCYVFEIMVDSDISLLTLTLPSIIFFFIISKYRGFKFLVTYCIADMSIACVNMLAYCIWLAAFYPNFYIDTVLRSCCMIIWAFFVDRLIRSDYHKALEQLNRGWAFTALLVLGIYVLIVLIASYPTPINQRPESLPAAIITMALMETMLVIVMKVISYSITLQENAKKEQDMDTQLKLAEQQYAMLTSSIDEIRTLKHDMKHHLMMISSMFHSGKQEELTDYLEKVIQITDINLLPYGRNYTISVITGFFSRLAEENQIKFECEVNAPQNLSLDSTELTALLGNMWQNAIEACEALPVEKRFIKTTIVYKEEKLVIRCENSFDGSLKLTEENELLSTKGEGHGQGIKNIKRLAGKSGGFCYFEHDDEKKIFDLYIVLEAKSAATANSDTNTEPEETSHNAEI